MDIPWDRIKQRIESLEGELALKQGVSRIQGQKELARLQKLCDKKAEIDLIGGTVSRTKAALESSNDKEMRELLESELVDLAALVVQKQTELEDAIIPADPHDEQPVFLEIRAGTGGQEAALFAADLAKMYSAYALKKGWRVSVFDENRTELQGVREIILHIEGSNVYGHLKFEAGVHRVQRVPKTETAGRVHTSTATVAVLPEVDEVEVQINPADLRIDVYRASGAGGQHVNTTDSAVRITHIPSGVVVACQDERSQHKNKAKALKVLKSRIVAHEKEKHDAELGQKRKDMIGRAMRSEKVRTYNFPQNRVTDHTVELTLKKLDYVMEGDLDEIVHALQMQDKNERRQHALVW
jgi:peptide chain release factor 1